MSQEEFSEKWKSGEIQAVLLEELEMDMVAVPLIIQKNTNDAIEHVRKIVEEGS
jgi:hypothetical protein